MIKMTIPQLRYLLSLGLREEHQLSSDQIAPINDQVGDDWLLSPGDEAGATDIAASEDSKAATDVGAHTLARDPNQVG